MATSRTPGSTFMALTAAPGQRLPQPIMPIRMMSLPAAWAPAAQRQSADRRRTGGGQGSFQEITSAWLVGGAVLVGLVMCRNP